MQKFFSTRTRTRLSALILFCLFIGLGVLLVPRQPTRFPDFVAQSPSPTGLKAFYTLLKNNIPNTGIWEKPVQALPQGASGQLMIMAEPTNPPSPSELTQWIKWMDSGNQVWLIMRNPQGFFDLKTRPAKTSGQTGTLQGFDAWQVTYQASIQSNVRLIPQAQDHVLLKDQAGVAAISRKYGKGELTVLLAPEWLTNDSILQHDNFKLIMPFVTRSKPRIIWFNDYIHGYSNLPSILGVYPDWMLILLAEFSLASLLWLWYKGKRFGPLRTPREAMVRFGDERIHALAAWYEGEKFYQQSLSDQLEFLHQALQARWGISANLRGQDFLEAAAKHIPANRRDRWLGNWQQLQAALSEPKISPQVYLKYAQLLDEMQKEVEMP